MYNVIKIMIYEHYKKLFNRLSSLTYSTNSLVSFEPQDGSLTTSHTHFAKQRNILFEIANILSKKKFYVNIIWKWQHLMVRNTQYVIAPRTSSNIHFKTKFTTKTLRQDLKRFNSVRRLLCADCSKFWVLKRLGDNIRPV